MKNKIFKAILILLITLIFSIRFPKNIIAEDYNVDLKSEYIIDEYGLGHIKLIYNIKILRSETSIKEFNIFLYKLKPLNIEVKENDKNLDYKLEEQNDSTNIKLNFNDTFYGIGEYKNIILSFNENNISKVSGNVLEINIPKIENNELNNFETSILIPKNKGKEAYISPNPTDVSYTDKYIKYYFNKSSINNIGIIAAFGDFQIFNFRINYSLKNRDILNNTLEIPIPPDTPYQKIYIENINPKPENIYVDNNGNWIAKYNLKSFQDINVLLQGSAQIFSNPRELYNQTPQSVLNNLNESKYWQTNNQEIKDLALKLKTVENIYYYVSHNLKYNPDRIRSDSKRLGSLEALEFPQDALCTEYTDLFITLTRALKIPSREIQGFAYTDNPSIQPLSLVSDVLHSWPEYWDTVKNNWISVDPTWESTTGNDYFNTFDMKHIAFVIHGSDSEFPSPPGSYKISNNPKKDIYVNYGELPENRNSLINIDYSNELLLNPLKRKVEYYIKNDGYSSEYNINIEVKDDSNKLIKSLKINTLPPHSYFKDVIYINKDLLGYKSTKLIKITSDNNSIEIPLSNSKYTIYKIIIITFFVIIISLIMVIKINKLQNEKK